MKRWRDLSAEERFEKFNELDLSAGSKFQYREDVFEITVPLCFLHQVLDKLIQMGYLCLSLDVFYLSSNVTIGAHSLEDLCSTWEIELS